MAEWIWHFSELLQTQSVPLLDDFVINLQESSQTSAVVLCNDLVQHPFDKKLKGDSLGHVAKKHQVVTLADDWDVFLLYGWGYGQVTNEPFVDLQQVLAFAPVTLVA